MSNLQGAAFIASAAIIVIAFVAEAGVIGELGDRCIHHSTTTNQIK
jgi:hypothetical protein